MKVRFLEAARADLEEAIRYYDHQRSGLGTEFKETVRSTVKRIEKYPEAWHPLSPNTRRCRTPRFPYGVIYHVSTHEVVVVAVAHLHREPDQWKNRL